MSFFLHRLPGGPLIVEARAKLPDGTHVVAEYKLDQELFDSIEACYDREHVQRYLQDHLDREVARLWDAAHRYDAHEPIDDEWAFSRFDFVSIDAL